MRVVPVDAIVDGAVPDLEARNVVGVKRVVRRLAKVPVLNENVGCVLDRDQLWAVLPVEQV